MLEKMARAGKSPYFEGICTIFRRFAPQRIFTRCIGSPASNSLKQLELGHFLPPSIEALFNDDAELNYRPLPGEVKNGDCV